MNRRLVNVIALLVLVVIGLKLTSSGFVSAASKGASGRASGNNLENWEATYWYLTYGGQQLPTDAHGNPLDHNVVMMPIPAAAGDGTPGSINVALSTGERFFLPLWSLLGQRYPDGSFDPDVDLDVFRTLDIEVKIDGARVITSDNVMDFYSEGDFDPEIPFGDSPFIWFQGIGMLRTPMTPGHHTITLDVVNTQPVFGQYVIEYHNTWHITVTPGK